MTWEAWEQAFTLDVLADSAPETRAASYTDAILQVLTDRAAGADKAIPTATGALEAAAGLVARAFASARVEGPAEYVSALSPSLLALVGRALMRYGETVLAIDLRAGRIMLSPSQNHNVTGGYDPASWRYWVHLPGPSTTNSRRDVPADGVLHFRYAVDPSRPWEGIGPLQSASLAGRLSAATMGMLADEAGGPRGYVAPLPNTDGGDGGEDDPNAELKSDLKTLNGGLALVESMANDWQSGNPRAPRRDWAVSRLGADPPAGLVDLSAQATREVLAACGLSPGLFDARAAAAAREAWRQALFGVIAPLGRLVEAELQAKLDGGISLSWDELRASDIQGRARAFRSLTGAEGGIDAAKAAEIVGFE